MTRPRADAICEGQSSFEDVYPEGTWSAETSKRAETWQLLCRPLTFSSSAAIVGQVLPMSVRLIVVD